MKLITKLAVIATLFCVAAGSFAQGGGGGQGRGFGRGGGFAQQSGFGLLRRTDVQTDLKLTDDQKAKIKDLNAKMREEMTTARENASASGGGDPSAMQDAMKKINDTYKPQFEAILTPDQATRLKQIGIQLQKNRAILDPDVQTQLSITDDQKAKIKDLQDKFTQTMTEMMGKMRDGSLDRTQMRDLMTKNNQTMDDELGKVLTSDQTAKLKDMGGPTFTVTDQPGGRGGGGGGGGRRRNRAGNGTPAPAGGAGSGGSTGGGGY
jgi:Spy/CpxP family protein refolding chaperone